MAKKTNIKDLKAIKKLEVIRDFLLLCEEKFKPETKLLASRTLESKISNLFGELSSDVDYVIKGLK